MGKLDDSLSKIKADARASRKGPDEQPQEFTEKRKPSFQQEVVSHQSQDEHHRPIEIISSENKNEFEVDKEKKETELDHFKKISSEATEHEGKSGEHRSVHFAPGVQVTKHHDLFQAVQRVDGFEWHPHIEACRTQTNAFEEIKKIRTNIINLVDRKAIKTIMVTSCKHAEGKTTTALALSRSLADLGSRRVCLIDGDMRRPRVKNFLNLKVQRGLDDVILGDADLAEAVVFSKEDNLAILPTRKGRSIASELLGSDQMAAIVRELCKAFDILVFDSPPCLSTTDPIVLGSIMDAISLTVKMNHTPRQSVEHSIALMRQSELPFVGLILTHHVVHYNTYLLQKYNYYQDYYGYYAYQDAENS